MEYEESKEQFPILEFDPDKEAVIRPQNLVTEMDIPQRCILTFFADEIEKVITEYPSKIIAYFKCDSFQLPIYEMDYHGNRIALVQAMVGAPVAARQIEDLTARGCQKYMICGDCGTLDKEIAKGQFILPAIAVRDEGTSYHYIKPSKEIAMDSEVLNILEKVLNENQISYLKTKTWTTDAFFRETKSKVVKRKSEGCLVVEMETAAYLAVAKFNQVKLGQILYASDSLDEKSWDRRKSQDKMNERESLLKLCIECCLKL